MPVQCICATCGRVFFRPPSRPAAGRGIYCSRRCANAGKERPLSERFWSKVEKSDGCWLWTGYVRTDGYGEFSLSERRGRRAHRAAWELVYGSLTPDQFICHRCDNRRCVRPDHLFLGTPADNSADMVAKQRQAVGDRNGSARLAPEDVVAIRVRAAGGESQRALARAFGVAQALVGQIVRREVWRHVI